jgi:excisionase family DNA binding protein
MRGWVFPGMANSHETPQSTIIRQLAERKTYVPSTECLVILGITRQTFCEWVRAGILPAIRAGNRYLVDPSVLSSWLRAREVQPGL